MKNWDEQWKIFAVQVLIGFCWPGTPYNERIMKGNYNYKKMCVTNFSMGNCNPEIVVGQSL